MDITNKRKEDAGPILSDRLRQIMQDLEMPDGLAAFGYTSEDIPALVKGTLPQVCVKGDQLKQGLLENCSMHTSEDIRQLKHNAAVKRCFIIDKHYFTLWILSFS